jgi:Ser/Thr protein kinase RdoA (MazF antagonist)
MTQARSDQKQFAPAAYAWLSDKLGLQAQSISLEEIRGSTSSSIYRVTVQHTAPPRCVLRVLDVGGWALEEPDLAEHEANVLIEAEQAGLQAPRLLGYASHDVGFGAPVVLMSYVPGRVQLQPTDMTGWLKALAGYLASIHQHRAPHLKWRFCSWVKRQYLAVPKWAKQPQLWEQAIALLLAGTPMVQPVFIHRDYHPANVLWQGDQISGVVDWINACQGAAGDDVAHCRINPHSAPPLRRNRHF